MAEIKTVSDLVSAWGKPSLMAHAIGVSAGTVRQWKLRGAIPAANWASIIKAARSETFAGSKVAQITVDTLHRINTANGAA